MDTDLDHTTRLCYTKLDKICDDALAIMKQDLFAYLNYYEWVVQPGDYKPPATTNWRYQSVHKFVSLNPHNSYDLHTTWRKISRLIRLNPNIMLNWNDSTCLHNRYSYLVCTLHNTKSPPIVAMDGGYGSNATGVSANTVVFLLCIRDIREGKSLESGEWQHRPSIPLLARYCLLPKM